MVELSICGVGFDSGRCCVYGAEWLLRRHESHMLKGTTNLAALTVNDREVLCLDASFSSNECSESHALGCNLFMLASLDAKWLFC